jgi:hypothetical protein
MIFIHDGIYKICRSVAPQFIKVRSYANISYAYVDAHLPWPLNDRIWTPPVLQAKTTFGF